MAYTPITNVAITLQTSQVTGAGFGTPLFATSHRFTKERVKSYTSLTDVAVDFPTTSNAYKAAQQAFANTPAPSVFKIGRREADLDITVEAGSTTASLTFEASDGTNDYSLTISATGVDEDAVASDIQSQIEADGDIGPLVTATVSTNVVSITPTGANDVFWVSDLSSELTDSYTNLETPADLITNLDNEDSDYYFVTADDHTKTFVDAMAAVIEAQERMFFTSSQEQATLTAYNESTSTDMLASIQQNQYQRVKGLFHQDADTTFPEVRYVAYNAPFKAGSVSWNNLKLGLSASKNPSTGIVLSTTEKGYLADRNAAFSESIFGQTTAIRGGGNNSQGDRISTIHGRDNLSNDISVGLLNLLTNQQGGKLSYRDEDILKVVTTTRSSLDRYVEREFINSNYVIDFKLSKDVPAADKANNIYQSLTFKAELAGEIDSVVINGTLVLDLSA